MRDGLFDSAFGSVLVGAGVLIAWFAGTLGSPVLGAIAAVYGLIGAVTVFLQVYLPSETEDREANGVDAESTVSLSSAPEYVREDLPPSSKLVWMYLAAEGGSTLDDIVEGTQLTPRTARNAITRLEKHEGITKRPDGRGSRQLRYDIRPQNGDIAAEASDDRRSPAGA